MSRQVQRAEEALLAHEWLPVGASSQWRDFHKWGHVKTTAELAELADVSVMTINRVRKWLRERGIDRTVGEQIVSTTPQFIVELIHTTGDDPARCVEALACVADLLDDHAASAHARADLGANDPGIEDAARLMDAIARELRRSQGSRHRAQRDGQSQ